MAATFALVFWVLHCRYAYSDFLNYAGGVYRRSKNAVVLGCHAVKVVGWGTDPQAGDYWVIANMWGEDWGEGGFARVARGKNECGIEVSSSAVLVACMLSTRVRGNGSL